MRVRPTLLLLLSLACSRPPPSAPIEHHEHAVGPSGTLHGTIVVDGSGDLVRDAVIRVSGPVTRETRSDAQGRFELRELPLGEYKVQWGYVGSELDDLNEETLQIPAEGIELSPRVKNRHDLRMQMPGRHP